MELNKIITTEKGIFMKMKEEDFFVYFLDGEKVGMYLPEIRAGGYLHEGRTWMIANEHMSEEQFIRLLEKENSK